MNTYKIVSGISELVQNVDGEFFCFKFSSISRLLWSVPFFPFSLLINNVFYCTEFLDIHGTHITSN